MRRPAPNPPEGPDPPGEPPRIIFVGLDMTAVEEARRADVAHAVVMGAILLLAGFAGITLLMLTQSYRAARSRLSRVQERLATAGRLAAGVAHEVRNPLSSIKGFATYFRERYRDVPSDAETAAILIQEVERLDRVVGQLLEFSRPVGIDPRPARLPELIANSLRLAEGPVRSKAIDVRTEYRTRRAEIRVDSDRLNQVLLNLYLNAVEAMEPGGRLQVAVEDAGREPGIRIRVSDTGCGIAPENLGQVFEPYFTTKPTGTGLGLAIAHNIVEAMGGRITVESRIGAGTTFEVNLPP
jgi:two-component system sensor histidine kinase HydH